MILHMIWSGDHDAIPHQTATKFQHIYLVDPTELLLIIQFYDIKAYLRSATSQGHDGGFL